MIVRDNRDPAGRYEDSVRRGIGLGRRTSLSGTISFAIVPIPGPKPVVECHRCGVTFTGSPRFRYCTACRVMRLPGGTIQ